MVSIEWEKIDYKCEANIDDLPCGGGIANCKVSDNCFAVFGGLGKRRFNELFFYKVSSNTFQSAKVEEMQIISKRCKASICCVKGNKLLIFGGWSNEGKHNDLYEYDIVKEKCTLLSPKSTPPPSRSAHGCFLDKKESNMYIYGGIGNKKFGDFYRYNLDRNAWETIPHLNAPLPRSSFGSCLLTSKDDMIVTCGLGCGRYNETLSFNMFSKTWGKLETNKEAPSKRGRHSSVLFDDKHVILWGGFDGTERNNDCYELNLESKIWSKVKQIGAIPSKRESHCVTLLDQNKMYLYGGWDGLDFYKDLYVGTIKRE
ncbi:hypothetical protein ABK040_005393 [Willaertia magna]